MFYECNSLISLPDLSKWNTSNVNYMNFMFSGCNSLISLPDLSKWNTSNVNDMSEMFCGCNSLISLPDLSNWNTSNITDMNSMFFKLYKITYLFTLIITKFYILLFFEFRRNFQIDFT